VTVNKYQPHLLIVPEDDANKDLALGFLTTYLGLRSRSVDVEPVAGGWGAAREALGRLCRTMRTFSGRNVLVLVDFDQSETRHEEMLRDIPVEYKDRVYILGVWSEPEALQAALGHMSRDKIGEKLARACGTGTDDTWNHDLLAHNAAEVERLCALLQQLRTDR